jgi:hypothetical protein
MSKSISRRDLLGTASVAMAASSLGSNSPRETLEAPIQSLKVKNPKLRERGQPEIYTGQDLRFIGMPVGGLFAGTSLIRRKMVLLTVALLNSWARLCRKELEPTMWTRLPSSLLSPNISN